MSIAAENCLCYCRPETNRSSFCKLIDGKKVNKNTV